MTRENDFIIQNAVKAAVIDFHYYLTYYNVLKSVNPKVVHKKCSPNFNDGVEFAGFLLI